jgi:hypothetical protein
MLRAMGGFIQSAADYLADGRFEAASVLVWERGTLSDAALDEREKKG